MLKLEGDIDILSSPSYKPKLLVEVFKFSHVYWIYLVNNGVVQLMNDVFLRIWQQVRYDVLLFVPNIKLVLLIVTFSS